MNNGALDYTRYNRGVSMIQNEQIRVLILKQNKPVKQSFGLLKRKTTKTTQEWKDELKKELYHD